MTQAANDNTITSFRVSDLRAVEGEPRVEDILLAERLGMAQPRNIRGTILKRHPELTLYGEVVSSTDKTSAKGGRPGIAYYLNEAQALLLCMFANTKIAAQVRKMLIDVFMEYRRGKLPATPDYATPLKLAREAVDASIAKMERAVADIRAVAHQPSLSAMVVGGQPVIVDVSDFMMEGDDQAVVAKHDGSLEITKPQNIVIGDNSLGRNDISREIGRKSFMRYLPHGSRSGWTPWDGRTRDACVILGKVVRSQQGGGHVYADHEPERALAAPQIALPPKRRRPMDGKTRAKVLRLYRENHLPLWEIAEIVDYPYHMVQRLTCAAEKARQKFTLRAVS